MLRVVLDSILQHLPRENQRQETYVISRRRRESSELRDANRHPITRGRVSADSSSRTSVTQLATTANRSKRGSSSLPSSERCEKHWAPATLLVAGCPSLHCLPFGPDPKGREPRHFRVNTQAWGRPCRCLFSPRTWRSRGYPHPVATSLFWTSWGHAATVRGLASGPLGVCRAILWASEGLDSQGLASRLLKVSRPLRLHGWTFNVTRLSPPSSIQRQHSQGSRNHGSSRVTRHERPGNLLLLPAQTRLTRLSMWL